MEFFRKVGLSYERSVNEGRLKGKHQVGFFILLLAPAITMFFWSVDIYMGEEFSGPVIALTTIIGLCYFFMITAYTGEHWISISWPTIAVLISQATANTIMVITEYPDALMIAIGIVVVPTVVLLIAPPIKVVIETYKKL